MTGIVITCEHGGCEVPREYAGLFRGAQAVLRSHRGYDPGALELARALARRLDAPLVSSTTTRLLVDLNRSPGHRRQFSEFTRGCGPAVEQAILARYYLPYRQRVESLVADAIARGGPVLHLSVHSFTPELGGVIRTADVGLLYDPARPRERQFCRRWRAALVTLRSDLRVRRNYPYRGTSDGLVTHLRRRFGVRQYVGIELEVNQRWPLGASAAWRSLQKDLLESFPQI